MVVSMVLDGQNEEETLLRLVKKGDEQAMQTLYRLYIRYLSAVSSRYLTNDEDIRDVLQDAFLKIFSSIHTFEYRGEGSLKGWMAKIVLHETLKFVQLNCRFNFVELKAEEMDVPDDSPDTEGIPLSVIYALIRELPDGYRTIFNLFVIEEKSHKEIAALLGIKESTSASQLHRAKALLAEKINQYKTINAPTAT